MNETNNTVKATIETEKKAEIKIHEHEPFKGDLKTDIVSSITMADIVSSMFAGIFGDYYGCKICVNDGRGNPAAMQHVPSGGLYVDIYFKDMPEREGTIKNLLTMAYLNQQALESNVDKITDETKKQIAKDVNLAARFGVICNAGRQVNMYKVSQDTYDALAPFMFDGLRTRWMDHVQEVQSDGSAYGKTETIVRISGLNLNAIISEIYGKEVDGTNYEYVATPTTAIPNRDEFIMMVTQLDARAVRDVQRELGIGFSNPGMFHQYIR